MWATDLLLSLVVPLGAWLGRRVVGGRTPDEATGWAAGAAGALAWTMAGGMLLCTVHLLRPVPIAVWLATGAFLALRQPGPPVRLSPALALGAPTLAFLLLTATVPAWYRDDLVYHLSLPRQFALAGGWTRPDDNIFASFPLGWESVHAVAAAVGRDGYAPFNPRLLDAWTAGAAALATTGLAREIGAPKPAFAGALWLLLPTVLDFGASGYVEPWLCLLTALALQAALRGHAVVAGALAGLAVGSKYPGLALAGFLATGLACRGGWRAAGRFSVVAVLVGCPFYLRNIVERGNPVFPLAWGAFGGAGWDAWRAEAYAATLSHYGAGRSIGDYALLPWRLFTTMDLRHGFEGSLGPLLALGLFGRSRPLAAFALAWLAWWAVSVQQVRFFLVATPALAANLATLPRATWALPLQALWSAPLMWTLWARQTTTEWLAGRSADAVLSALTPLGWTVPRALEAEVPPGGSVRLVWVGNLTYWLRREARIDCVFEAWRLEAALDAGAPFDTTHLLVNEQLFLAGANADTEPGRTARLRQRWETRRATELTERRRWGSFVLYEVTPPRTPAP
jgi:hypothetical protein